MSSVMGFLQRQDHSGGMPTSRPKKVLEMTLTASPK